MILHAALLPSKSQVKGIEAHMSQRSEQPELILVSVAWSMPRRYCYSPLDGMLVHHKVTTKQYVAATHLYTWAKRDKVE